MLATDKDPKRVSILVVVGAGLAMAASGLLGVLLVDQTVLSSAALFFMVAVIAVAFLGEALFGFGGGLLAIPLVSLLLGVRDAVMLVLLFQLAMGVLLFRNYRAVAWKPVRLVGIGLLIGVALGTVLLVVAPEWILRLILAVFIFLFLIKEWFFKTVSLAQWHPGVLGTGAGVLGGWLHGIIGTGGPPFVMFLSELKVDKVAFRATLILLLFVCNVVRVAACWSMGLFTEPVLTMSAPVWPLFGLALFGGQRLHALISERAYRLSVYTLLFIAGVSLTLKGLMA